jgi:hypothetical protein
VIEALTRAAASMQMSSFRSTLSSLITWAGCDAWLVELLRGLEVAIAWRNFGFLFATAPYAWQINLGWSAAEAEIISDTFSPS